MGSGVFLVFYINQKTSLHIKLKKRYGISQKYYLLEKIIYSRPSRAMMTTSLILKA